MTDLTTRSRRWSCHPGMTYLDLGKEHRTVATAQQTPFDEVAAVALDGVEASWLDDAAKRAIRAKFETTLAARRQSVGASA